MRCFLLALITLGMAGCASSADDGPFAVPGNNGVPTRNEVSLAQADLENHNLQSARLRFMTALSNEDSVGEASAGLAFVELMLLPYDPTVTDIITTDLGGTGPLNSSKDVLYADSGILYFLARGASWDDEGGFIGIRSIIEPDLPWELEQIESSDAFFDGATQPLNDTMQRLTRVADRMSEIETLLTTAIDDKTYRSIVIPGQVFHHDSLSLDLSKADLAMLRSVVKATRGGIYFVAGYDWDFSLADALGSRWTQIEVDPNHPEHVATYDYIDYVLNFLSERAGRAILDTDRLGRAGIEFQGALDAFRQAITLVPESLGSTLGWRDTTADNARAVDDLFGAMSESVDEAVPLPASNPAVSIHLEPFFDPGRTLNSPDVWLQRNEVGVEPETELVWGFTEAAEDWMYEGIIIPNDGTLNYTDRDKVSRYFHTVFDEYVDTIEDVYSL